MTNLLFEGLKEELIPQQKAIRTRRPVRLSRSYGGLSAGKYEWLSNAPRHDIESFKPGRLILDEAFDTGTNQLKDYVSVYRYKQPSKIGQFLFLLPGAGLIIDYERERRHIGMSLVDYYVRGALNELRHPQIDRKAIGLGVYHGLTVGIIGRLVQSLF